MNCDWLIAKENSEQDKKWLCNKTFHWIFQFVSQKMHKRQSRTFTKWLKWCLETCKKIFPFDLLFIKPAHLTHRATSPTFERFNHSHMSPERPPSCLTSQDHTLWRRGAPLLLQMELHMKQDILPFANLNLDLVWISREQTRISFF